MTDIQKLKAAIESILYQESQEYLVSGDDYDAAYAIYDAEVNPAAVLELIADEEEATDLCNTLSGLLRDVALVVRGREEPLKRHGFADLPSRVKTVVDECERLKAELESANARLHEVAVACATAEQERDQLKADGADVWGLAQNRADTIDKLKAENEALRNYPLGVANEYAQLLTGEISKSKAEKFQQRMNCAMEIHRRMSKEVQS